MRLLSIALLLFIPIISKSQNLDFLDKNVFEARNNERYGMHKRNTFDIILPLSETPTGLVIFIHGGGFKKGSKNKFYNRTLHSGLDSSKRSIPRLFL